MDIDPEKYYIPGDRQTRGSHRIRQPQASKEEYRYSIFLRSRRTGIDFQGHLQQHLPSKSSGLDSPVSPWTQLHHGWWHSKFDLTRLLWLLIYIHLSMKMICAKKGKIFTSWFSIRNFFKMYPFLFLKFRVFSAFKINWRFILTIYTEFQIWLKLAEWF